jgi:predicted TPR repeat methyltransferase
MKSFEVIQAMAPDLPEGIVSEGILAYEKEDIDMALECADRACQKNQQFRSAFELKGMSHEKAGEWEDAVKAYKEMLNLDPNEKDLKKKLDGLSAKIAAMQEEKKKHAHYSYHEDDRKIDTTNN